MGSAEPKSESAYRRVLLKLSGEALAGEDKSGIDPGDTLRIAEEIGRSSSSASRSPSSSARATSSGEPWPRSLGIKRVTGDHMGMLATVMNSLALQNALERIGVQARVMSAFEMKEIAEPYIIRKALDHLEHGRVVIAAGGTGHPFFTTDTAASLRAVELEADGAAEGHQGRRRVHQRSGKGHRRKED